MALPYISEEGYSRPLLLERVSFKIKATCELCLQLFVLVFSGTAAFTAVRTPTQLRDLLEMSRFQFPITMNMSFMRLPKMRSRTHVAGMEAIVTTWGKVVKSTGSNGRMWLVAL